MVRLRSSTGGGAPDDEDHHGGDQQQQRCLAQQRVDQQAAGQRLAQLQRLGDLDRRHALATAPGDGLQQHRHPHRRALVVVVVEVDQRGVGALDRQLALPAGQLLEARDGFTVEAGHAVVEAAAVVGLERLQRRIQQRRLQVRLVAFDVHLQQLADRFGGGQQGAVVGDIGGAQRLAVEHRGVDDDEAQHRQQDAQHQLVAQRAARPPAAQGPWPHSGAFSR
jgi:hypothetical protein